jgi:hypothetical protein
MGKKNKQGSAQPLQRETDRPPSVPTVSVSRHVDPEAPLLASGIPLSLKLVSEALGCQSIDELLFVEEVDVAVLEIPEFKKRFFLTKLGELKAEKARDVIVLEEANKHRAFVQHTMDAQDEIEALRKLLLSENLTALEFEAIRKQRLIDHGILVPSTPSSEPKNRVAVFPPSAEYFAVVLDGDDKVAKGGEPQRCGAFLDFSSVEDGKYTLIFFAPKDPSSPDHRDGIIVAKFQIEIANGKCSPSFVDTCGSEVQVTTFVDDVPTGGVVTVTPEGGSQITRSSGVDGKAKFCLPPGKMDVTTPAGSVVVFVQKRDPLLEPPTSPVPPQEVIRAIGCPNFSNALPLDNDQAKVAVCGDISGSMNGKKMTLLTDSFKQLCAKAKGTLRLYSWNGMLQKAPATDPERQIWIDQLLADGGNDMRYAIEQTVKDFPDVTELYIMCDGDVSPFNVPGTNPPPDYTSLVGDVSRDGKTRRCPAWESSIHNLTKDDSWEHFVNHPRYKNIRFHFIPLGGGADHAKMSEMASIGRGNLASYS